MAKENYSISHVSRMFADTLTPYFDLEHRLRDIASSSRNEELLCVLLRTKLGLDFGDHEGNFFHECHTLYVKDRQDHSPFELALVRHSRDKDRIERQINQAVIR